jgi:hypothetical protein
VVDIHENTNHAGTKPTEACKDAQICSGRKFARVLSTQLRVIEKEGKGLKEIGDKQTDCHGLHIDGFPINSRDKQYAKEDTEYNGQGC